MSAQDRNSSAAAGTPSAAAASGAAAGAAQLRGQGTAFGIDIGGSGIKGGRVDLADGALVGERIKIQTPSPATPDAVADTVAEIVERAEWTGPVGITMPSVIRGGVVRTAANIDEGWIGVDAVAHFRDRLGGTAVRVVNDADAAGIAEDHFGGASDIDGVVMLLTFGTGIGSAILNRGVLVPNTEFGHLEVDGVEAEHRAASSARNREQLSWKQWSREVSRVLTAMENLVNPDVFIVGGGISRQSDKWVPRLTNSTPVRVATLHNTAGIVGAALLSSEPSSAVPA